MKVAASRAHQTVGVIMIVAAVAYLVPFVPRGWIPHDEGMLGQSADRVLRGDIPHIDYQEAYTGGLSWLYAAVFRISGVDLLNLRWFLFAAASWAVCLMYAIIRRYLRPVGAALATWVALTWSFPNYFAGLPSWWLLICALACIWAMIRHVETQRWRYLVAAGLAVGLAMAIKQTGVYLLVALVLSLLYDAGWATRLSSRFAYLEHVARWGAAACAIAFAAVILVPRIFRAEGLYLFLPAAACALVLFLPVDRRSESSYRHSPLTLVCIVTAAAALPLVCLLIPYIIQHRLWDFAYGAVILPNKRLAFASAAMPGAWAILSGIPLLWLVFAARHSAFDSWPTFLKSLLWTAAILLPIVALWNKASYQAIWQSARAFAALVPVGICWQLVSGQIQQREQRPILFVSAAMLAWASLNQFPFAAAIYFCYVAPLVVIAGIAAASAGSRRPRHMMVPWAVMLLLFAVLSANRAYIESLGVNHAPRRFDAALNLPRAHLKIADDEAEVYRRLVFFTGRRLRGGELIAGPDCPEVYFLLGLINPSGTLFDFFSEETAGRHERDDPTAWSKGAVIVLNHAPHFSPAPSRTLTARLRREFPHGEDIGRFEVRWR